MAKWKNSDFPADVVKNWMRTKFTIDFLGIWEKLNNPNFKLVEFDQFKNQAGDRVFVMSPEKWIKDTNAIGIKSKSGRYGGGTFAHKDIAFEFATWLSPEFKLFLIKEFQRLKEEENDRLSLGWDLKRSLAKINYRVHTDAIKENLIPKLLSTDQINDTYASEADILNKALFGMTAKEWQIANPKETGNMRDNASVTQLVCLSNLESLNAVLIQKALPQNERLALLNETAIIQMKSLSGNESIKKLT